MLISSKNEHFWTFLKVGGRGVGQNPKVSLSQNDNHNNDNDNDNNDNHNDNDNNYNNIQAVAHMIQGNPLGC